MDTDGRENHPNPQTKADPEAEFQEVRLQGEHWAEEQAERDRERDEKRAAKIASGQLLPGRIAALVALGVVAVLLVAVALINFASMQTIAGVCISTKGACSTIRTYAYIDLLLAACAAVGAVLVYWSRPR